MSCCGKNNGNFYTRPYNNNVAGISNACCARDKCGCKDDCCDIDNTFDNPVGLAGISSPCFNNNDIPCECGGLRDVARRLTNQRVIIHINGCKMCVIIIGIGCCFIKAVNYSTNKVVYFNINRIDDIEDVLPRCCN